MYSKQELNRIEGRFDDVKKCLLLLDSGEIIYALDMITTEHKKMVNKGLFGLGGKVEKSEYTIDEIHFRTRRTKKGMVSVWNSSYMCSELGMWHLEKAKDKYRLMNDSMTKLGYNVVRLPKKKAI